MADISMNHDIDIDISQSDDGQNVTVDVNVRSDGYIDISIPDNTSQIADVQKQNDEILSKQNELNSAILDSTLCSLPEADYSVPDIDAVDVPTVESIALPSLSAWGSMITMCFNSTGTHILLPIALAFVVLRFVLWRRG